MKNILLGAVVLVLSIGMIGCGKADPVSNGSNNETRQLVINNQETDETSEGNVIGAEPETNDRSADVNLADYDLFRYFAKTSAEVQEMSGVAPENIEDGTQHFALATSVMVYTDDSEEHKVNYLNISAYNNESAYHIGKYWMGMSREDIDRVAEEVGYHWMSEESKIVRFTNDIHVIQFYLDNGTPARVTQISLYWYDNQ